VQVQVDVATIFSLDEKFCLFSSPTVTLSRLIFRTVMLMPASPPVSSDTVSFEVDPDFITIDADGCPTLSLKLIERCQKMFAFNFHWTIVSGPSQEDFGIQLTIPALSTEAYFKVLLFETQELSPRPWKPGLAP
jgi:hypothetical protein